MAKTTHDPGIENVISMDVLWGDGRGEADATVALTMTFSPVERRSIYHLHLIVDVSTSMNADDRFGLTLDAVKRTVRTMRPDDRLSITLFAHESAKIVDGQPAWKCSRDWVQIRDTIRNHSLIFTPKTYLATALDSAARLAAWNREWITRVIVLTDGEIMDLDDCGRCAEPMARCGAEFRGLGFGGMFNAGVLRRALASSQFGGVQRVWNFEDIPGAVEHLVKVGENVIGRQLEIHFETGGCFDLPHGAMGAPVGKALRRGSNRELWDEVPIIEAQRDYRYLLGVRGVEGQGDTLGNMVVWGSFSSESDNARQTFRFDLQVWPPGESGSYDPQRVLLWVQRIASIFQGKTVEMVCEEIVSRMNEPEVQQSAIFGKYQMLLRDIETRGLTVESQDRFDELETELMSRFIR